MHDKRELDVRMLDAGIKPLKHLGQNFLLNPNIIQALIKAVVERAPSQVVEVGPGLGALTDDLITNFKNNLSLIEMDSGLVKYWQEREPGLNVIHKDAMEVDWEGLTGVINETTSSKSNACLVSNLPYSIAATLVLEITKLQTNPFSSMILMFQKEVAQKFQALKDADDYGIPTVLAQTFWKIEKLIDAGPQDFFPVPNVGSRVLIFTSKQVDISREGFFKFVKKAFEQRRKKMISNLKGQWPQDKLQNVFKQLNLKEETRAQELSPDQFCEFYRLLS
jgi:16S rRNA (adenine1518-N6/adenine1519-N6)-dimethyltransferase